MLVHYGLGEAGSGLAEAEEQILQVLLLGVGLKRVVEGFDAFD
jgi:hypothetical protein